MPTGYTADVQSGKITEFGDFAMQCARAFGALIMLRDDPMDAQIPDEFLPGSYYSEALDAAKAELARLEALGPDEVAVEHEDEAKRRAAYHQEQIATTNAQKDRYDAMLAKAQSWRPPTEDHAELKKFMIQQLEESIRFDCRIYEGLADPLPAPMEWQTVRLHEAKNTLARAHKNLSEEIERCASRSKWVRDLRASLATTKGGEA